jgi:hypothetical protein
VTTPSKLAPAILIVFGLPFLGMGLFAAYSFLNAANQPLAGRVGAAIFASVFAVIGGGLIFGSLYGYSRQKEQAVREMANPSSPWLWRQDWAASRVESKNKSTAIGWWIAAVLVNMLSLPTSLAGISQGLKAQDPKYIAPAGFELIGLIVLFAAIRATIRFERFGKTYFEMNSLPFSPGCRVAGAIHVQLNTDAAHGVDLKLSCIRSVVTGSGDNRSTQKVPLWEDSKNIPATSLNRGPLDTIIPVEFAIPTDAFQTDHDNPSDQVQWLLKANADVPGVDYSDEFELPVFRTSQSAAVSAAPAVSANLTTGTQFGAFVQLTTTPGETAAEVAEPAQHRVVVNEQPDGLEFYFRAGRNIGRTALVVALAAGCSALFYAMLHMQRRQPMFALVIVGVMAFILIMASVHAALTSSRIVVGNGMISWKHSILGIGNSRQVQISEVDSILPLTSIQQASSSGTLYSLRLQTKAGKNHTLVDDIESRQEARWIVSQIEKRAGLRLNTQVQINNTFYGPPPQPGANSANASVCSAGGIRVTTRSTNNWSQAIGIIFFFGWVGFIAFMMFRTPHARNATAGGARATAGVRPNPRSTPRFVRTEQMKNTSLDEVLAWPPQQQAEELMARAVAHDSTALQAFAENMPAWVGHIQLTDNLGQLENQGRYSSDLRVRRAEADLELTLDGWAKTPHSVDLLMGLAKTDPVSRPRSLYFLGVLAGDGVESESAHKFILDYARSNSDPAARQWATEGLRFVGTDEALDELFDIFTHDASFAVRDRAGCNISDCGVFERKQRLRMVPRLIDLVSDPHANPQMRNWSFLALQEITDESIPPDAVAWRRWYNQNGSAKRARFEALDWWQVRGDS